MKSNRGSPPAVRDPRFVRMRGRRRGRGLPGEERPPEGGQGVVEVAVSAARDGPSGKPCAAPACGRCLPRRQLDVICPVPSGIQKSDTTGFTVFAELLLTLRVNGLFAGTGSRNDVPTATLPTLVEPDHARCESYPVISGSGRAGASDAAHRRAAESAQADFAFSQRRIHSLQRADGTVPNQTLKGHHPADTSAALRSRSR
jgi:hypothetical protein